MSDRPLYVIQSKPLRYTNYWKVLRGFYLKPNGTTAEMKELIGLGGDVIDNTVSFCRKMGLLPLVHRSAWTRELIKETLEKNGRAILIAELEVYAKEQEGKTR